MFFEILKASKGLYTDNIFAEMWGKRLAGQEEWQVTEITGYLPLTFLANGDVLQNYRLHGTSEGAGVQTDNLFDKNAKDPSNGYVHEKYLTSSGSYVNQSGYDVSEYIPIDVGVTYYLYWVVDNTSAVGYCFYDENKQFLSGYRYGSKAGTSFTVSAASYIRFSVRTSSSAIYRGIGLYKDAMVIPEPYGYQIPLTNTSGVTSDDYNIYIGSTKLGEEEYVDYESGKVWKMIDGMLTPTDPPAPLPEITTFEGENTLSSSETVGSVTIKGKIKTAQGG